MVDVLFGVGLAVVMIRGWMRGLLRQSIEIGVVVVGLFLGFRLSGAVGSVISSMAGTGRTTSRIVGGIVVFALISVGAAVASRVLHWGVRALPGLTTLNRLGGSAAAGGVWVVLAAVIISLLAVLPVPEGVSVQLEDSAVAATLTDPDGVAQSAVSLLGGDRAFANAIALERLVGRQDVVAAAPTVKLPRPAAKKLSPDGKAAKKLFEGLNRERVAAGVDPLAWSEGLGDVAMSQARVAYRTGRIERLAAAELDDALTDAAIPVVSAAQSMVLAPSREAIHDAMVGSPFDAETMRDPNFSRVGVAVVRGPYGLLATYVFSG